MANKYLVVSEYGYVTTIYRNTISESKDMGNALECHSVEDAKVVKKLAEERENKDFKIVCVEIKVSTIESDN